MLLFTPKILPLPLPPAIYVYMCFLILLSYSETFRGCLPSLVSFFIIHYSFHFWTASTKYLPSITKINHPPHIHIHTHTQLYVIKQAGAELGQAQLQLELGFTLFKVCCIILMITNYHYISLSTISLWTWLLPLTRILASLIASFHAGLLTYFPKSLPT